MRKFQSSLHPKDTIELWLFWFWRSDIIQSFCRRFYFVFQFLLSHCIQKIFWILINQKLTREENCKLKIELLDSNQFGQWPCSSTLSAFAFLVFLKWAIIIMLCVCFKTTLKCLRNILWIKTWIHFFPGILPNITIHSIAKVKRK